MDTGIAKERARKALQRAVRAGKITKSDRCSSCGQSSTEIEAHHDNYKDPLNVKWLCRPCHLLLIKTDHRVLTARQVEEIREKYVGGQKRGCRPSGPSMKQLGREYGVSHQVVWSIIRGYSCRPITESRRSKIDRDG